jgi:hypothetical protein
MPFEQYSTGDVLIWSFARLQSMVVSPSGTEHGYARCSLPPTEANSHSASVGKYPPSQMQNAIASYQLTQFIALSSLAPAL